MNSKLIILCLLLIHGSVWAQNPKAEYGTFALTQARIVTVTKGIIEQGTLVIQNGKIVALGENVPLPKDAFVINCSGLSVYPGMIDSGTKLGLKEIGSDQRTKDYNEIGDVIPQVRALSAINTSSAQIPVTRLNGVTTVLTSPEGDLLSGTAALINLYGYTSDEMYAGFEGVVLNFPCTCKKDKMDKRSLEEIKAEVKKSIDKLNSIWEKVAQYHRLDSSAQGAYDYYPELQALLPVYRGEMTLLIEVNKSDDIVEALKWVKKNKINKVILTGVAEGWRVADQIAAANLPAIVGPILALPTREYDRYDKAYMNAGLMKKAGVKVAIRSSEVENSRNLPYNAGFAGAFGMGPEGALRAITIEPAEIFGVADRLGSLETGKEATLFICDGDPLEPKTNITQVFIKGWKIPMVSRQTLLYDEYLHRPTEKE